MSDPVGTRTEIANISVKQTLLGSETVLGITPSGLSQISVEAIRKYGAGIAVNNLTVTVSPFCLDGFMYDGGSFTVLPNGTWFLGVELSSKQLRALPRRGHRGVVYVARVVSNATLITSVVACELELPATRIPRTLNKVINGKPINVLIMGSSLTQTSGSDQTWPSLIFGSTATVDKYKIPNSTMTATGVGGSPNAYQLAQVGIASNHGSYSGFGASGVSGLVGPRIGTNGRSKLFKDIDVVVLGCLANGGDYRLENIEQTVRRLVQMGKEVILVTDNPQNPTTDYGTLSNSLLHVDGPEVIRIANLYGVELADTSSYVFEAHLRANGTGIFGDTIHQAQATPSGPNTVLPASGHEAWARAVRSLFSVSTAATNPTQLITNGTFDTSTVGWSTENGSVLSQSNGQMTVTASGTNARQGKQVLANVPIGSSVTITLDLISYTGSWDAGLISTNIGSWDGGNGSIGGLGGSPRRITKTFTNVTNQLTFVFYNTSSVAGDTLVVDNISVSAIFATTTDQIVNRRTEIKTLPPSRIVTDLGTPGDMFVILPKDEFYFSTGNGSKGTLGAHPWGNSSFARRFSSHTSSTGDLLSIATGQKACISATGVVSFNMIHYRDVADGACTFTVTINSVVRKTVTISTPPFGNEWWLQIMSSSELNAISSLLDTGSSFETIEIAVTSGTLKIAALVSGTVDATYISVDEISYKGTWLPNEVSVSNLYGKPTDTVNSMASVNCPGRRLAWIISANPGSKSVTLSSGSEYQTVSSTTGVANVILTKSLYGPNERHSIRCDTTNASGSQATGHSLHIGGAMVIYDR